MKCFDPGWPLSPPALTDRKAQGYGDQNVGLRYSGASTINVYTNDVDKVRAAMAKIVELGKAGIAVSGQDYEVRTEFLDEELAKHRRGQHGARQVLVRHLREVRTEQMPEPTPPR